ncbi:MAG: aldehyde dehydrogenase family protein [Clostridia bacterium]|nr:aldehyde dehydrogenase family protein [Clostridia bacterium]
MDNKEYIQSLIDKGRKAQESIETYSQEQVDKMVRAIGKAIYDAREELSKEAVEETHFGNVPGKVAKHAGVCANQYLAMRGKPSVGIVKRIPERGLIEFAKPLGVITCVTPSTNPTTTVIADAMPALKCRNAIVVAPHPSAKKCSKHAVDIIRETLVSIGAPADLVQCIEEPSLELTNLAMELADVVVATGGPGMVKAAYSSGKPSFGVGQGNAQVVLDTTYTDYDTMAKNIIMSRAYDNGVPCTGEQTIHVPKGKEDAVIKALVDNGCWEVKDAADIDKIRQIAFTPEGRPNTQIVGKLPPQACKLAGVEGCPEDAKLLIMRVDKCGKGEPLAREIMCPILRVLPCETFAEGVEHARTNLLMEGAGHSATVYSLDDDNIKLAGDRIPVCRMVVNQPNVAGSGRQQNGLMPTSSLGCGSWGNNSISENLTYYHFMNTTRVAYPLKGVHSPSHDEIWQMG